MIISCLCGTLNLKTTAFTLFLQPSTLAHDTVTVSDIRDLFVQRVSCLAGVFIYHQIDLFLQGWFFSLPVRRPQETHCSEDTGRSGQV